MSVIAGAIIEVTYNHPTVGSGSFYPFTDEDATYDLGGYRSNDDMKAIDGSGAAIQSKTLNRWMFEVAISIDMNTRKDYENLVALASSNEDANWTFTSINGTIYGGQGTIVGDTSASAKDGKATLKVSGGGILKQL